MTKTLWAKDLKPGTKLTESFLVADLTVGKTKKNTDFARCKLLDKSGSIAAKMWDYDQAHGAHLLKVGAVVLVVGTVEEYLGMPDFKIEKVSEMPPFFDQSDYEKASKYNRFDMEAKFVRYTETFSSPLFNRVAQDLIKKDDHFDSFMLGPAATGIHHAFKSGLLEHTVQMLEQAEATLELPFYKEALNKDLCMFGVMFHDFGKIFEYSREAGFKKTTQGALVPHIPMMGAMIYESCVRLGVSPEVRDYMMHVVLAHHREIAWGSPVSFACPEAAFVHYIDNMHGDVFGILQRMADSNETLVRHTSYNIVNKKFSDILGE